MPLGAHGAVAQNPVTLQEHFQWKYLPRILFPGNYILLELQSRILWQIQLSYHQTKSLLIPGKSRVRPFSICLLELHIILLMNLSIGANTLIRDVLWWTYFCNITRDFRWKCAYIGAPWWVHVEWEKSLNWMCRCIFDREGCGGGNSSRKENKQHPYWHDLYIVTDPHSNDCCDRNDPASLQEGFFLLLVSSLTTYICNVDESMRCGFLSMYCFIFRFQLFCIMRVSWPGNGVRSIVKKQGNNPFSYNSLAT